MADTKSDNGEDRSSTALNLWTKFQHCTVWFGRALVMAILLSLTIWLIIRPTDPSCYLDQFTFSAFNDSGSTSIINFNFKLRNGDCYQSIDYGEIYFLIWYIAKSNPYRDDGFHFSLPGFHQGPRNTTKLKTKAVNYTTLVDGTKWGIEVEKLRRGNRMFYVKMAVVYNLSLCNHILYRSRQVITSAYVYFDGNGTAFLDPPMGLLLQSSYNNINYYVTDNGLF